MERGRGRGQLLRAGGRLPDRQVPQRSRRRQEPARRRHRTKKYLNPRGLRILAALDAVAAAHGASPARWRWPGRWRGRRSPRRSPAPRRSSSSPSSPPRHASAAAGRHRAPRCRQPRNRPKGRRMNQPTIPSPHPGWTISPTCASRSAAARGARPGPARPAPRGADPRRQARGDGWTARMLPGGTDFQLHPERYAVRAGCALRPRDRRRRPHLRAEPRGACGGSRSHGAAAARRAGRSGLDLLSLQPELRDAITRAGWISERMFVGAGVRKPSEVVLRFFALN